MNTRKIIALTVILGVLLVLAGAVGVALAQGPRLGAAVGTAFTYQGQLSDGDEPANGSYDFQFELHDHPTEDSQVGSTILVEDKDVSDGRFTVQLDFGSGIFNGEARYLEIGVRPWDSSADHTILAPRQELTAAPYAHYALNSLTTESLQGHPVSDTVPTSGQLLQWNGSAWEPGNPNLPPVALLYTDRSTLMPGETTTLSLTLSYDPEGGPLTYAFDPTGQTPGPPSSFGTTAVKTLTSADYTAPGDYLAAGWVKDAVGVLGVARTSIAVYHWSYTTPDSSGDVGFHASLAVVDGRPAIAYHDGTNDDLEYVRASDASASSWNPPLTVVSTGTVGAHISLAVVDGRPAIAYYDDTPNYDLKYMRATDATGSSWGTPVTVDSTGNVGQYASLAVVENRPAIAYYDASLDHLKYVRASNAAGSSWGTPVTVDSSGEVGQYASLAVVDGRPAVAYYDDLPNFDLMYVWASDATGSSWGTPVTVDTTGDVGKSASLAVVDGRPAIAYRDDGNYDVKYVRAADSTGSSWGTPLALDSTGDWSLETSLAVVRGRPAIAYLELLSKDLKYVWANDVTGSSWGTPVIAESAGDVEGFVSLAECVDRPGIAYLDTSGYNLHFAIPRQD